MISGRKARVLVIDDDSSVADTLAMVLSASGFDATAAYSGETALELARLTAFDSVVADVMMEPMNGIQTALAISLIHPGCQVLLISGNDRISIAPGRHGCGTRVYDSGEARLPHGDHQLPSRGSCIGR